MYFPNKTQKFRKFRLHNPFLHQAGCWIVKLPKKIAFKFQRLLEKIQYEYVTVINFFLHVKSFAYSSIIATGLTQEAPALSILMGKQQTVKP